MKSHPRPQVASATAISLVAVLAIVLVGVFYFNDKAQAPTTPVTNATAASSPTPASAATNVKGTVYYSDASSVYAYVPATNTQKVIDTGIGMAISHDKTRIAYLKPLGSDATSYSVMIYTIATGKTVALYTDNAPSAFVAWSPDDSYLIIDEGTSPIRAEEIVSTTGQKIGYVNNGYVWINNTQLVFPELSSLPMGDTEGYVTNLSLYDVTSNKITELEKGTSLISYAPNAVSNNVIHFTKTSVASSSDWDSDSTQTNTYFAIKPDGSGLTQENAVTQSDDTALLAQITANLPSLYKTTYQASPDATKEPNYEVFSAVQNTSGTSVFVLDDMSASNSGSNQSPMNALVTMNPTTGTNFAVFPLTVTENDIDGLGWVE